MHIVNEWVPLFLFLFRSDVAEDEKNSVADRQRRIRLRKRLCIKCGINVMNRICNPCRHLVCDICAPEHTARCPYCDENVVGINIIHVPGK